MTVPARRPEDDALDAVQGIFAMHGVNMTPVHMLREALERLREERAKTAEQGRVAAKRYSEEAERRMVAEAEVRRLTEGLREIAKDDDLVEANEGAFSIHAYRRCRDLARALLSASPPDGGEAGKGDET